MVAESPMPVTVIVLAGARDFCDSLNRPFVIHCSFSDVDRNFALLAPLRTLSICLPYHEISASA
jgi:hypothetical protein